MSDEDHLRILTNQLLLRKSVSQIDFYVGAIHVDVTGFGAVRAALFSGAITVVIGGVPPGAGAAYKAGDDAFHFTSGRYGANLGERMGIVHECVHALNDIRGAWASSPRGGEWTTATQDEVSAYVAGALFMRYESGGQPFQWPSNSPPQYAAADIIAGSIMNTKGAAVPEKDVMNLRILIAGQPLYHELGLRLWTPANSNGLH